MRPEDMDCNFAIPEDGIFYSPKDDEYIQDLSKGDRVPYKVVDYDEYLTSPKAKLIIICKPEYMDQIIERSKTFHSDDYKSSSLKTASVEILRRSRNAPGLRHHWKYGLSCKNARKTDTLVT